MRFPLVTASYVFTAEIADAAEKRYGAHGRAPLLSLRDLCEEKSLPQAGPLKLLSSILHLRKPAAKRRRKENWYGVRRLRRRLP